MPVLSTCALACATTLISLEVNRDRLGEVVAEIADIFLRQGLSCNDYASQLLETEFWKKEILSTFKSLFDVNGLLGARLEIRNAAL